MESKDIYQDSYNALVNLRKALGSPKVTIDFDKFDANTKEAIRDAILKSTSARQAAILNVLGNANSSV